MALETIYGPITGKIGTNNVVVSGSISHGLIVGGGLTVPTGSVYPVYDGTYEITPLTETDQILSTSGKRMTDDVVVLAIPYYETTNESGGYTVNIG